MKLLKMMAWLLLTGALCTASVANASATAAFSRFATQAKAGAADFEQTVYDKNGRVTQQAQGKMVFARPGKFRWTYTRPKQLIVGDGVKVWIYDEDLQQVTVRSVGTALSSTPAALLAGGANIEQLFTLAEQERADGINWLEARPKQADTGFERIRIGFNGDTLAAMELFDQFGSRTLLKFTSLKRNPALERDTFTFAPPKGVDVVAE